MQYKRKRLVASLVKKSYREASPSLPYAPTSLPCTPTTPLPYYQIRQILLQQKVLQVLRERPQSLPLLRSNPVHKVFQSRTQSSNLHELSVDEHLQRHARSLVLPKCLHLLFENFFTWQNHRRNVMLIDMVPPANVSHFPQETIANELASSFGGCLTDFLVARYSERDYVIFLPF